MTSFDRIRCLALSNPTLSAADGVTGGVPAGSIRAMLRHLLVGQEIRRVKKGLYAATAKMVAK